MAMDKEVSFLPCGRVSGLVMTVSGLMDGVSDGSGINILKMRSRVKMLICLPSCWFIHASWLRVTVEKNAFTENQTAPL